jgi:hypothetical protein
MSGQVLIKLLNAKLQENPFRNTAVTLCVKTERKREG